MLGIWHGGIPQHIQVHPVGLAADTRSIDGLFRLGDVHCVLTFRRMLSGSVAPFLPLHVPLTRAIIPRCRARYQLER